MRFQDKLRELREAKGLSEAKLAELSGVPFGTLHNYGLGIRKPTFAAVVRLARALGTTCEAFAQCDGVADDSPAVHRTGRKLPVKPNRRPRGA